MISLRAGAVALLVIMFVINAGSALWLFAKAELAEVLIAQAWTRTMATGQTHRPWRWADTWPLARLRHRASATDLYVLAGADGTALAFGPGHLSGTAPPGQGGSLIAGHRDTHFRFLRTLQVGEVIELQTANGEWQKFAVDSASVVDSQQSELNIEPDDTHLYLVTCYPFNALVPGGPLRYLVVAKPQRSPQPSPPAAQSFALLSAQHMDTQIFPAAEN